MPLILEKKKKFRGKRAQTEEMVPVLRGKDLSFFSEKDEKEVKSVTGVLTLEVQDELLAVMASGEKTIKELCREKGIFWGTYLRTLKQYPLFRENMKHAREYRNLGLEDSLVSRDIKPLLESTVHDLTEDEVKQEEAKAKVVAQKTKILRDLRGKDGQNEFNISTTVMPAIVFHENMDKKQIEVTQKYFAASLDTDGNICSVLDRRKAEKAKVVGEEKVGKRKN